ncbi:General transcription factor II-I repeat domain containing protein 2 [Dissostichus eleginoides]|uniref:General transcription factor II-I repeat domain containing protein 2 n=1 Tax=Dissostichus eleginoides TaxID=100907 RepID=A0AAD9BF06_DISEL|nr:General transcription factor II-I repeat domain containing protein 2 [Dissostichus eleginoides]
MPLSAKTVKDRTIKMAENITSQQIEDINSAPAFSIACDESSDVNDIEQTALLCRHVKTFLESKGLTYPELEHPDWLEKLHFMVDMTGHLNMLNKSLQGKGSTALQMLEDVLAFERKMTVFARDVQKEGYSRSGAQMERYGNPPQTRQTCVETWNAIPDTYMNMKKYAFGVLSIFGSTYLCEQIFSSMNYIKSKYRSRLTDDSLRSCVKIKVTSYSPDIEKLSSDVQKQKSH